VLAPGSPVARMWGRADPKARRGDAFLSPLCVVAVSLAGSRWGSPWPVCSAAYRSPEHKAAMAARVFHMETLLELLSRPSGDRLDQQYGPAARSGFPVRSL